MNTSVNISKVVSEMDSIKGEISKKNAELHDLDQKISTIEKKILAKKVSIKLEKLLNSLPNQAIGTIEYYNKLNERVHLFDRENFNKITRFLDFVEKTEKSYNLNYEKSRSNYYKDPYLPCYDIWIKEYNSLNKYYKLLETLIFQVDRDIVKYNKVYNFLEDKGLFLTSPEKHNLHLLEEISDGVRMIYGELDEIVLKLDNIDETLRAIQSDTSSMDSHLWDISFRVSTFD
ncbi:hypothetical protein BA6E_102292 [Bacteroidales bacterium 6E]|nr:hypothetical protein BA6E_102292 [Bacteroidales bacterium 6E]